MRTCQHGMMPLQNVFKIFLIFKCLNQPSFGQFGLIQLDLNPDTSEIPVLYVQDEGYATTNSWAEYNGTISTPLASFTFCVRVQVCIGSYERMLYQIDFP